MKRAFVIAVAMLLAAGTAQAGSLFAKGSGQAVALYADDTARKIGDNITIVIKEARVIKNETKRDDSKASVRSAKMTGKQDIVNNAANAATGDLFNLNNLNFNIATANSFQGDAKYNSDDSVTDLVTVQVSDVLPNGNLLVIGTRERGIEGDKQIVQVSGLVRPSDISFANTVASEKIGNFKIVYKHVGPENCFTKPGWLDRILNRVSPF